MSRLLAFLFGFASGMVFIFGIRVWKSLKSEDEKEVEDTNEKVTIDYDYDYVRESSEN